MSSFNPDSRDERAERRPDGRTAILPSDKTLLRVTPAGQPTVDALVGPGDVIKTNYQDVEGTVVDVSKHTYHGLPAYTIEYVPPDIEPNKNGSYRETQVCWINECVAQDGRILKLHAANKDEVFVVSRAPSRQLKLTSVTKG